MSNYGYADQETGDAEPTQNLATGVERSLGRSPRVAEDRTPTISHEVLETTISIRTRASRALDELEQTSVRLMGFEGSWRSQPEKEEPEPTEAESFKDLIAKELRKLHRVVDHLEHQITLIGRF